MNRSGYKAVDIKKATIHSFMKSPISHVSSMYPFNPNQIGFSVPYFHDTDIPYELHENNVIVDSLDRDMTTYRNPYELVFDIDPVIKNVKYINIENVILPYLYELVSQVEVTSNYTSIINAIDASRNQLFINTDVNIAGRNIQICNFVLQGTNWEINYTENKVPTTVYKITKNSSTQVIKYTIGNSYISNKVIFFQIDNIDNHSLATTSSLSDKIQLYPKKIISNSVWFDIKRRSIVFKNSETKSVSRLRITFIDDDSNKLTVPNLDYTVTTGKYDASAYSSPKYYIRHPLHSNWQVHLFLQFGQVQPFIKQFI
jgi:hypothetical protein